MTVKKKFSHPTVITIKCENLYQYFDLYYRSDKKLYLAISFIFFNALTLTMLRAGFAANIIDSPVKGLIP